jgi:hypothetical protein
VHVVTLRVLHADRLVGYEHDSDRLAVRENVSGAAGTGRLGELHLWRLGREVDRDARVVGRIDANGDNDALLLELRDRDLLHALGHGSLERLHAVDHDLELERAGSLNESVADADRRARR